MTKADLDPKALTAALVAYEAGPWQHKDSVRASIEAYLAALPAQGQPEPVAKPLEWEETSVGTSIAVSVVGRYRVDNGFQTPTAEGMQMVLPSWRGPFTASSQECTSLDAAKAAAQADYTSRIMSALAAPSSPIPSRVTIDKDMLAEAVDDVARLHNRVLDASIPDSYKATLIDQIGPIHDKLTALSAVLSVPAGDVPTHRHKKRGSEYVLIGIGKMQAENWGERVPGLPITNKVDMREVAIYRSVDDGSLWARPREEFEDGRFEPIHPAPEVTHAEHNAREDREP